MRSRQGVAALVALVALAVPMAAPARAAPPANDDIADAVRITSLPFAHATDTSEATVAPNDPYVPCSGPLATVWYTFRLPTARTIVVDTAGSDYDTTLAVFRESDDGLVEVDCSNGYGLPDGSVGPARSTFRASAGVRYFVMAGTCCGGQPGEVGPGGTLVLTVLPGPPTVRVEVTIDAEGSVDRYGTATVTGTVRCTQATSAEVYVVLRQVVDRHVASGVAFSTLVCSREATPWSYAVETFTSFAFGPGAVDVSATARVAHFLGVEIDTAVTEVRLRRPVAAP